MSQKELPPIVNIVLAASLYAFSCASIGRFEGPIDPDPNVPKSSLLHSGNPESAEEVCGGNLPQLVSTSPSSYICIEAPRIPTSLPIKPQPEIVIPPAPAQEQQPVIITYTVKRRNTFSEIIQKYYGSENVYDEYFREVVFLNADLLARKTPAAKRAIEQLKQHPDWTPKTNKTSWELFMTAARLIHSGDTLILPVNPN